ncbi:CGGC domain-containing protein [Methanosarcina barkeri]|uniref:CGGC domain-containing protein n=1 Tax=Methanosarcina barkeri TaxID=2208 RepID=UPI00064F08A3|nr:CGGC domain-containing protein [Methanosarcina barkeri]
MVKVAILCCDNVKNELSCPAAGCFRSFNEKTGSFERYKDDTEARLVGFSTCAGCPTLLAPEKIIKKIKPLVEISKAEKIHLSSCMAKMCPFVNKYKSAINVAYPDVEVVMGTDAVSDQHIEIMKTMFKKLLTDPNPDISEEYLKITQSVE